MSNIHGLFSKKDDDNDDNEKDQDDSNNRYVGGIGDRGGGSGLAVQPNNNNDENNNGSTDHQDAIFGLAEQAGSGGGGEGGGQPPRRTITMYRSGFVVDDGPYRRLDDPENAEFLRSLAMGRTPRELLQSDEEGGNNHPNVTVGLIDKRSQEYEETFRSFSGTGNSLGTTTNDNATLPMEGVLDPLSFSDTSPPSSVDSTLPTTSIQVRLMNGKRQVFKINLNQTVQQLGQMIVAATTDSSTPFVLTSGFPPRPITNLSQSIEEAGLKGAQVIQKKA